MTRSSETTDYSGREKVQLLHTRALSLERISPSSQSEQ